MSLAGISSDIPMPCYIYIGCWKKKNRAAK